MLDRQNSIPHRTNISITYSVQQPHQLDQQQQTKNDNVTTTNIITTSIHLNRSVFQTLRILLIVIISMSMNIRCMQTCKHCELN